VLLSSASGRGRNPPVLISKKRDCEVQTSPADAATLYFKINAGPHFSQLISPDRRWHLCLNYFCSIISSPLNLLSVSGILLLAAFLTHAALSTSSSHGLSFVTDHSMSDCVCVPAVNTR
jgi:hypothetical protein